MNLHDSRLNCRTISCLPTKPPYTDQSHCQCPLLNSNHQNLVDKMYINNNSLSNKLQQSQQNQRRQFTPLALQCTSAQYNVPINNTAFNKAYSLKSSVDSPPTHNFLDATTQLTSTTTKEWGCSFASSTPKTLTQNNCKKQTPILAKPIEPTYFHWNVAARKNNKNTVNLNSNKIQTDKPLAENSLSCTTGNNHRRVSIHFTNAF